MKKYFLSLLLLFTPWLLLAGTEEPQSQERSQEEISEAVHWSLNLMNGRMGEESYIDIQKAIASHTSREAVNKVLAEVVSAAPTDIGLQIHSKKWNEREKSRIAYAKLSSAIAALPEFGGEENLPLLDRFMHQTWDDNLASGAYYSAFAITNYREDFVEDFLKNTFMGSVKILGFHQRILEVEIPKARKENNIELQIHLLKMIRKGIHARELKDCHRRLFSHHNLDISKIDGEIAALENQVAASREKESSRTREASAPASGISLWYLLLAIPFLAGIFFWQKKRSSGS